MSAGDNDPPEMPGSGDGPALVFLVLLCLLAGVVLAVWLP